jgi:PhnB protein
MAAKPIPEGHPIVSAYLVVEGAAKLIDFMKGAFDAEELFRLPAPDGMIGHAEMRIGDSVIMLADSTGEYKPFPAMLHIYAEDCDLMYKRAVEAGGTPEREPADQFYGDRNASVRDGFGNTWFMSTHKEDVSPEEMQRRMEDRAQRQGST